MLFVPFLCYKVNWYPSALCCHANTVSVCVEGSLPIWHKFSLCSTNPQIPTGETGSVPCPTTTVWVGAVVRETSQVEFGMNITCSYRFLYAVNAVTS